MKTIEVKAKANTRQSYGIEWQQMQQDLDEVYRQAEVQIDRAIKAYQRALIASCELAQLITTADQARSERKDEILTAYYEQLERDEA